jgi:hypothetical protein
MINIGIDPILITLVPSPYPGTVCLVAKVGQQYCFPVPESAIMDLLGGSGGGCSPLGLPKGHSPKAGKP